MKKNPECERKHRVCIEDGLETGVCIDYMYWRPSPRCPDGHRQEIDHLMNETEWGAGLGFITRDGLSPEAVLECIAYAAAFENVFDRHVDNPGKHTDLLVREFMARVDDECERVKAEYKQKYRVRSVKNLKSVLVMMGFRLEVKII